MAKKGSRYYPCSLCLARYWCFACLWRMPLLACGSRFCIWHCTWTIEQSGDTADSGPKLIKTPSPPEFCFRSHRFRQLRLRWENFSAFCVEIRLMMYRHWSVKASNGSPYSKYRGHRSLAFFQSQSIMVPALDFLSWIIDYKISRIGNSVLRIKHSLRRDFVSSSPVVDLLFCETLCFWKYYCLRLSLR